MGGYYSHNLLRTAKLKSLQRIFDAGGQEEVASPDMVLLYNGEPLFPPPTPAQFLSCLRRRGAQEEAVSAQRNREIFGYLFELGISLDLAEKPHHADHLRECGFRPRRKSRLATELSPDDIVLAEYVGRDRAPDGYSTSEDTTAGVCADEYWGRPNMAAWVEEGRPGDEGTGLAVVASATNNMEWQSASLLSEHQPVDSRAKPVRW